MTCRVVLIAIFWIIFANPALASWWIVRASDEKCLVVDWSLKTTTSPSLRLARTSTKQRSRLRSQSNGSATGQSLKRKLLSTQEIPNEIVSPVDVCLGSVADISGPRLDVRKGRGTGHWTAPRQCRRSANSGHGHNAAARRPRGLYGCGGRHRNSVNLILSGVTSMMVKLFFSVGLSASPCLKIC
jgi:hypothetical protein